MPIEFTAQEARNIAEVERIITLGKVIDAIKAGAKEGHEKMNIEGVPIDQDILDTLKERGFDVSDKFISWELKVEEV